jgi:hypothetical protein
MTSGGVAQTKRSLLVLFHHLSARNSSSWLLYPLESSRINTDRMLSAARRSFGYPMGRKATHFTVQRLVDRSFGVYFSRPK